MSFPDYIFGKKKVRQDTQPVSPMAGDDDTADQPGPSGAQRFVTEGQLQQLLQALSMTLPQAQHGVQQHPQQSKAEKKTQLKANRAIHKRKFTIATRKLKELLEDEEEQPEEEEIRTQFFRAKEALEKVSSLTESIVALYEGINPDEDVELNYMNDMEEVFDDIENDIKGSYPHINMQETKGKRSDKINTPFSAGYVVPRPTDQEDQRTMKLMSANYDVTTEVRKFSGENRLEYKNFRKNWDTVDTTLCNMGKTPANRLALLKKVLEKEALELVGPLPDDDDNYVQALQLLDDIYYDNNDYARTAISELCDQQKFTYTFDGVKSYFVVLNRTLITLKGLQVSKEARGDLLLTTMCEKHMPAPLLKEWSKIKEKKKSTNPGDSIATPEDLSQLLKDCMKQLSSVDSSKQAKKEDSMAPKDPKDHKKGGGVKHQSTIPGSFGSKKTDNTSKCIFCSGQHKSLSCNKLKELKGQAAKSIVGKSKVCWICFESDHHTTKCGRTKGICSKCPDKKHHFMIHVDAMSNKSHVTKQEKPTGEDPPTGSPATNSAQVSSSQTNQTTAILHSLMAWAIGPDGSKKLVRVFLDGGSEINLIKRSVAEVLGLHGPSTKLQLSVAGGNETAWTHETNVCFKLQSIEGTYISPEITATTIKTVTSDLRAVPIKPQDFKHLKDVAFTEAFPRKQAPVDIMIGEPIYSDFLVGQPIKGEIGEPVAIPSKLGYFLGGGFKDTTPETPGKSHVTWKCAKAAKISEVDITDFWNLEHLGITPKENSQWTPEEHEAVEKMEKSLKYDPIKREWSTKLLWKDENAFIEDNYNRAVAVMKKVERSAIRENNQEMINDAYDQFVQQGYAEKVPQEEINSSKKKIYYLQTHPIIRKDHETTKCRIVMNAGAKDRNGNSLNDLLHQGPCLLKDLLMILLRFRFKKWVLIMDIQKMFLRIKLHDDIDCLRYVWRNCNTEQRIEILRMLAVTFGVNSSPFQAVYTVLKHSEVFEQDFPDAKTAIHDDMYMDDVGTGTMEKQEAIKLAKELLDLLWLASMIPHKFAANDKDILQHIPAELHAPPGPRKLLGVQWDPEKDNIMFSIFDKINFASQTETKRSILQQIGTIFDPMGLLTPLTLRAKIIFQQLWLQKINWDQQIPNDLNVQWQQWKNEINPLTNLEKSRCILKDKELKQATVVAFGDASEAAYGSAVYVKSTYIDGTIECNLVMAKSRVAPLEMVQETTKKLLTIVRLELIAALCTARAAHYVAEALRIPIEACFTDSLINLGRIKRGGNAYKQWVGNRINEIAALIPAELWHFCPGLQNPADLASRGSNASELTESKLWWHGPDFINLHPGQWPKLEKIPDLESTLEKSELQPSSSKVSATKTDFTLMDTIVDRFENWEKFLRFSAYILRMGHPEHKQFRNHKLSVPELKQTELFWIQRIQQRAFQEELATMQTQGSNGILPLQTSKTSRLKDLNPMFDQKRKIIFSESRLIFSDLPESTKRPIILPKNDKVVKKYVIFMHKINGHAGPELTLSLIRQRYRIIQGRRQVRTIIRGCPKKKCTKPPSLTQIMAPLPKERTTEPTSFKNVSVDLFGPLFVKHSCVHENCPHPKTTKVYGCLYTCFHTRAVHIELLEEASSEDFFLGFRNFISRRGCPSYMFSDNGKNFVHAAKELRMLYRTIAWKKLEQDGQAKGIEWVFNVEKAPWANGLAERLVKSTKQPLRIILGQAQLTFRQLQAVIHEVESILNNRPLSQVGDDPDDLIPITPSQLIIGRRMDNLADPNFQQAKDVTLDFKTMWRKRQVLLNSFWKRWSTSYLQNLNVRQKWRIPNHTDLQNRVVLIRDDNMSRNEWKMGRIVEQIPSKDGMIRAVRLQTSKGFIRRPIQRLALLENVF